MACASCGTGSGSPSKTEGKVSGCSSGGCATGGCNRMNNYDWLQGMVLPDGMQRFNILEVRFKGGRKEFFRNTEGLDLIIGDAVLVDVGGGYHIGRVALTGELVRLQLKRKGMKEDSAEIKTIFRLATQRELERHQEVANRELPTLYRTRHVVEALGLKMKVSDVEYQADGTKASFFYSAEDRVDFRELIKQLAGEFKIRVDMRQISLRQEAGRLGGIGSCGRELCCSTWLTEFKGVSTSAARYQNLSLNPIKLSGQCGRLKCCLNYELETYMDALKTIPKVEKPILTNKGEAYLQKTDIFKQILWFGYKNENTWHPIPAERVKELMAINKAGNKAIALTEEEERTITTKEQDHGPLNEDIFNLDKKFADQRKKQKPREDFRPNRKPQDAPIPKKEPVNTQTETPEGAQNVKPLVDGAPAHGRFTVKTNKPTGTESPSENKTPNKFKNKRRPPAKPE